MDNMAKKVMNDMMENYIDEFMATYGFYRRGKSLNYSRKINDTKQSRSK